MIVKCGLFILKHLSDYVALHSGYQGIVSCSRRYTKLDTHEMHAASPGHLSHYVSLAFGCQSGVGKMPFTDLLSLYHIDLRFPDLPIPAPIQILVLPLPRSMHPFHEKKDRRRGRLCRKRYASNSRKRKHEKIKPIKTNDAISLQLWR